ncbi:YdcF family protein [Ramlibacter sp.]|uniref:YdcF family protein n=1 Tax=Ramlibacter sp. TaxID=1917967 RepID=UPI002630D47A|nr:YdcF family protein [Ramlibacter sp.]MDB5955396.1 hypothetical protein [Ramlibacter sp.]
MQAGEWKPVLAALVLPPAGPLLFALIGIALATRRRAAGLWLASVAIALAYLLATNGFGLLLARHLAPATPVVQARELQQVQAIVILGGGVLPQAPEYGTPQLGPHSMERLRYGAWLARRSGKPLAFSGGLGWGNGPAQREAEASVARRVLQEDYGLTLRWTEDRSRDTAENADRSAQLLQPAGVHRIALVTSALHMPRALREFRRAGFEVLPAPTGFPSARGNAWLEWLPTPDGAVLCWTVIREALGRAVAALH